jgi:tetratricopeptide (TPR) repeat protein
MGDNRDDASEESLRRSIEHIQAAQRVLTMQTQPYFWASCEINLGNIYSKLPFTRGNFKRAVSHLERALKVCSERSYPHEWGLVQMLLSKSYMEAAQYQEDKMEKNERAKLLRRSIACSEASRRGYTYTKEWEAVALTLSVEALAWRAIPTGNRREHLRHSINCWRRAAECFNLTGDNALRAVHLNEVGTTLLQLVELTRKSSEVIEACKAFEAARDAFARAGDKENATQIDQKLQGISKWLQDPSSLREDG